VIQTQDLNTIIQYFHDCLKESQPLLEIKTPLIKYVPTNGFEGIIGKRRYWLTDYMYMFNQEEIIYAKKLVKDVLMAQQLRQEKKEYFLKLLWKLLDEGIFTIYVSSFCKYKDDLHMWNEYADKRRGLAIIMRASYFQPLIVPNDYEYSITTNVFYDERQILKHLNEIFRLAKGIKNKLVLNNTRSRKNLIDTAVAAELLTLMPAIKSAPYQNEGEHRLYRVQLKYDGNIWPNGQKEFLVKEDKELKKRYIESPQFDFEDVCE